MDPFGILLQSYRSLFRNVDSIWNLVGNLGGLYRGFGGILLEAYCNPIGILFGFLQESCWTPIGVLLECYRRLAGVLLESIWSPIEVLMESYFGILLDSYWNLVGIR